MTVDPKRAQLDAWLEALLLREIAAEWEGINWALFREKMRRPIFELVDATGVLGMWRAHDRTIAISRAAAISRPWTETVETLKHEAAHQFVDEILGGDEAPHGPRFREVCRARGIDARATAASAEGVAAGDPSAQTKQSKVVARVQKLLALAESSNQHEAELAAATAQRIMLRYNLDLQDAGTADAGEYGHLWLGEPTGRVQPHQRALALLLADHFFVQVIWLRVYRPLEGKHGSVLEVCGRPENLAMAEYVHQFVLRTVERLWVEHKRATGLRSDRDRRSFLAGAVEGLSDKLQAGRDDARREGLVWAGDAAVYDYYRRRHPRIVSTSGAASGSREAYSDGKSAGKTIVLSRPVSGGASPSTSPRALRSAR